MRRLEELRANMEEQRTLGEVIRQRRIELGLTQEQLAERISAEGEYIQQSDISRLERGRVGLPRRPRLERIAVALGLSVGELLAQSGWTDAERHLASSPPSHPSVQPAHRTPSSPSPPDAQPVLAPASRLPLAQQGVSGTAQWSHAGANVARVMTISLAHNDIVPLSNTIRNLTVRVATAQQGFRGYLFLIDRAGSEAVSIGFWDSHEAMLQSEASGFLPQALRRLEPFLAAPPAIEYFGVSARANLGVERGGGRVCQIDYASLTDFTVNDIIGQFQQRVEQRRQETNQLCRAVLLLHLISGQAMAIGMWQENDAPRAPEGLGGAMSDLESAALIAPARSRRYHVALEV